MQGWGQVWRNLRGEVLEAWSGLEGLMVNPGGVESGHIVEG